MLPKGSHLVVTRDCYRRRLSFSRRFLGQLDVEATVIEPGDNQALEDAIQDNTVLFFTESPTNPYLRVMDIPAE